MVNFLCNPISGGNEIMFIPTTASALSIKRFLSSFTLILFIFNTIIPPQFAKAELTGINLPPVGSLVNLSPTFTPSLIKGITVHPENPLKFDFIVDMGDKKIQGEQLKAEANKMIKYFLASLTVPEKDLWVNLSPYEKGRIVADEFGQTEMGRDLLAQDYLLKQLTASLIYPENDLGKEFWSKVRAKVQSQFGTTNLPVNTFNKVWIVPNKAVVYEHNQSAFVVESHLKVMLEEDYLSLQKNSKLSAASVQGSEKAKTNTIGSEVIRSILIPEIEKEINQGKNFANLRQIYNSMILAVWYKQTLRNSLLGKVYMDQNKIKGVDLKDKQAKEKIYQQYLQSFKKGAYNYIKEEIDPATRQMTARKYFSGGAVGVHAVERVDFAQMTPFQRESFSGDPSRTFRVSAVLGDPVSSNPAMNVARPIGFLNTQAAVTAQVFFTKLHKQGIPSALTSVGFKITVDAGNGQVYMQLKDRLLLRVTGTDFVVGSYASGNGLYILDGNNFLLKVQSQAFIFTSTGDQRINVEEISFSDLEFKDIELENISSTNLARLHIESFAELPITFNHTLSYPGKTTWMIRPDSQAILMYLVQVGWINDDGTFTKTFTPEEKLKASLASKFPQYSLFMDQIWNIIVDTYNASLRTVSTFSVTPAPATANAAMVTGDPSKIKIAKIKETNGKRPTETIDITRFTGDVGSGKIINPRSMRLIADLMAKYGQTYKDLMRQRSERLAKIQLGKVVPGGKGDVEMDQVIKDAYGGQATVREILEGNWKIDEVPEPLKRAGAILTGPWSPKMGISAVSGRVITDDDRKLYDEVLTGLQHELPANLIAAIEKVNLRKPDGQLLTKEEKIAYVKETLRNVQSELRTKSKVVPVRVFADLQDAKIVHGKGPLEGPQTISDIVNGRQEPVVRERDGKVYEVPPQSEWPVITIRIDDMDVSDRHITYDGEKVPDILSSMVFATETIYEALSKNPNQEFTLVIPKMEDPEELVFVTQAIMDMQKELGIQKNISEIFMNETNESALKLELMLWAARHHVKITNVGRWDKGAADMRIFWFWLKKVYGDLSKVDMFKTLMDYYVRLNFMMKKRGVIGEGGMVTLMPSEGNAYPEDDKMAIRTIVVDKLYEWLLGYDYGWVASPSYLPLVQVLFQQRRAYEAVLKDLDYEAARERLLEFPEVPLTEAGLYADVYEEITYLFGYRNTGAAVAIDSLTNHTRSMFDGATGKKTNYHLWMLKNAGSKFTGTDTVVTEALLDQMIDKVMADKGDRYRQFVPQSELDIAKILAKALYGSKHLVLWEKELMNSVVDDRDPQSVQRKVDAWLEKYNAEQDQIFADAAMTSAPAFAQLSPLAKVQKLFQASTTASHFIRIARENPDLQIILEGIEVKPEEFKALRERIMVGAKNISVGPHSGKDPHNVGEVYQRLDRFLRQPTTREESALRFFVDVPELPKVKALADNLIKIAKEVENSGTSIFVTVPLASNPIDLSKIDADDLQKELRSAIQKEGVTFTVQNDSTPESEFVTGAAIIAAWYQTDKAMTTVSSGATTLARINDRDEAVKIASAFISLAKKGLPRELSRIGFSVDQSPANTVMIKLGTQSLLTLPSEGLPQTDYSNGNGLFAAPNNIFVLKVQDSFIVMRVKERTNQDWEFDIEETDARELAEQGIQVADQAMSVKNPLAKSGLKRTTTKEEREANIREHRHRTRYADGVFIRYVNTPEKIAAAQAPIQTTYSINELVGRKYRRQQREHFRNGTTTGTYGVTNQVEGEAVVNRSGKIVESEISDQNLLEILGLDASRSQVDALRQDLINQGYLGIDKKVTRKLIELDPINFQLSGTYQGIEKIDIYYGLLNFFWLQIKAIYQGGWAEIMKYFGASDQAKAPTNYLSLEPAEISNLLIMHARHQEERIASMDLTPIQEEAYRASRKYVDFYIPIVMDIDHGHGQPQQIIHVNLTAGRDGNLIAAVHIENQCHKKCGHMSRKSLKPTVVWEDATNQVREMLEILGFYDVSIVDRADSEDAEVMSGNVDGRDQEFMLGLTTLITPEKIAKYRADQESELRTKLLKDVSKGNLTTDKMEQMITESMALLDQMAKFMIDEHGVLKTYQDVMDYAEYDLNLGGADQEAVDQLWKDLADVKRLDDLIEETLIAQGASAKITPQQWLEFLQSIPRNYETKYTQLVIKKAKELGIVIHSRDAWVSHKEWQTGVMQNGLVHLLWDNNITKINEDGYDLYMFGGGVEASVAHHLAVLAISDQLWSEQKKAFGLDTIIWAMALDQGAVDLLIKEDFWGLLEGHEKIKKEKGSDIELLLRRYLIQRRIVPQEAFLKTRESLERFGLSAELAVHLINSVSKTKANNNSPSFRWALQKIGVSKEHLQRTINNILKFLPSFKHVATKPEDLQKIWEETHSSLGLKAEPVIDVKRFMTEDEKKNFIRVQGRDVQFQFSTYLGEVKNHVLTQLFLQGYEGQEAEAKLKEILLQVFGPGFINNEAYVISKLQELGFAMDNAFTEDTQTFAGVKYDAYIVTIGKGKAQRFAATGGKNDEQKDSLAAQMRSKEKADLEKMVEQARERIQSATTVSALSDLIVEYHSWLEAARKKVTKLVNDRDIAKAALRTDIDGIITKLKNAKEDRELISPLVAEAIDKIMPMEGAETVALTFDTSSLDSTANRFRKYPGIYNDAVQGVQRDLFGLRAALRAVALEKARAEADEQAALDTKEARINELIHIGQGLLNQAMVAVVTKTTFMGVNGHAVDKKASGKSADAAMTPYGGINLDPAMMNLQIKRDGGKGIPLPLSQQPIGTMKIDGFMPIIINISPVQDFAMLLGFNPPLQKKTDYGFKRLSPLAREPEQLTLLK